MATYRFELNDKPSRNGKYSVFLRVTVNGIRKKLKTSIEVNRKSDWNPTPKGDNWIRPSEPNSKAWNMILSKTIEKAKETYQELERLIADVKPCSRHMLGMSLHLQTTGPLYVGASAYLGDTLTVYPYFPETISVGGAEYVGSAIHLIDTVEISPSGN